MAEELGDKTELPSQHKRNEARKKGQIAKSADLAAGVDLLSAFIMLLLFGAFLLAGLGGVVRYLLDDRASGTVLDASKMDAILWWTMTHAGLLVAPFLGAALVVAVISQLAQVGPVLTTEPLMPKLDKLNPITGVQRLFQPRNVVKTLVNLVKLSLVTVVTVMLVMSEWDKIATLALLDVQPGIAAILAILVRILGWILTILLIIGLSDFAYQRWQQTSDLKMTKQEVKDEAKSMEGDQETKGRRLRIARQMAMQRINKTVPKADVIVTNPTHFSVALKYDPKKNAAPIVVAKGADFMAFRIREVAALHRIPIVERPPLARALYWEVPVGRQVPAEQYAAVAEILAYVYRLAGKAA